MNEHTFSVKRFSLFTLLSVLICTAAVSASAQEETPESGDTDGWSDDETAAAPDEEAETEMTDEAGGDVDEDAAESEKVSEDAATEDEAADEDEPEESESDEGGDAEETSKVAEMTKEADAFFSSIGIRRLRAGDFAAKKTTGIAGGSLSQTSHGLQWPRMKQSGIGVSGYVWIDTGYEKIDRKDDPNQTNTKYLLQEGRFLLRVTPTYTRKRWFIQGQAELVANKDQSITQPNVVDTDDIWIKVGMWDLFDLQVGRFEAWELYHFGLGMDINTLERRGATESRTSDFSVPDVYGVTFAYYRPNGVGNVAAHFYPTDFFRFELLGQVGNEGGGRNTGAFRGAGVLDFGFVKIKGGGEYIKRKSTTEGPDVQDDRGAGGTIQFVFKPWIEFGGSGGWAITDRINTQDVVEEEASVTTWSAGGFLNARIIEDLIFGAGANYTRLWDIHEDEEGNVGEFAHLQTFGALQYLLFKRLFIKAVVAWAKGDVNPSFVEGGGHSNFMISGRLRLQYNF